MYCNSRFDSGNLSSGGRGGGHGDGGDVRDSTRWEEEDNKRPEPEPVVDSKRSGRAAGNTRRAEVAGRRLEAAAGRLQQEGRGRLRRHSILSNTSVLLLRIVRALGVTYCYCPEQSMVVVVVMMRIRHRRKTVLTRQIFFL